MNHYHVSEFQVHHIHKWENEGSIPDLLYSYDILSKFNVVRKPHPPGVPHDTEVMEMWINQAKAAIKAALHNYGSAKGGDWSTRVRSY